MESSSGKTVKPLVRQKVTEEAAVERTPIRGLVKMKRPVEGRQVKLLCAQAQGEASWAYHAYIGDFDEAVGKGAFDPDLQLIFDRPRATSHLADVPLHTPERRLPLPKYEWLKCEWLKYATARLHQGKALQLVEETRQIAKRLAHRQRQRRGWPPQIHPPISKHGAGRLVEHLSSLVALACVRQSGWWEEYWQLAKARRHSRRMAA